MQYDVAILGGGAAGMMAAVAAGEAAARGGMALRVALLEKNVRPGIKVLVCGGGRCNFTNAGSREFLIGQFGRNGRFLTPALEQLDNEALRGFFAGLGVPSHVEHDGKVYPDSNEARSVVDALVRRMSELGVEVFAGAGSAAAEVARSEAGFRITTVDRHTFEARQLILAVGGMSYQRMGTTGDGYRIAASLGHTIVTPRPAIVGLLTEEDWPKSLAGLAVRDVAVTIIPPVNRKSKITNRKSWGDLLLTHFGLSGPAILNPSETVAELLETHPNVTLGIDFARHTSHDRLHVQLRNWQQHHGKKQLKTLLSRNAPEIIITTTSPDQTAVADRRSPLADGRSGPSLPGRLAEKFCQLEQINPDQPCATLTSAQIHRLVERIKNCPLTITATRGFKEAMVTAGGVKLSEVNPRTMESKLVPGLFLVGEVLDLTGPSGGYNLQLAFSTGHLAGAAVAQRLARARES